MSSVARIDLSDVPHATAERRKLLEAVCRLRLQVAREEREIPGLKIAAGHSFSEAGRIQQHLDADEEAIESFEQAIALFEELKGFVPPDEPDPLSETASVLALASEFTDIDSELAAELREASLATIERARAAGFADLPALDGPQFEPLHGDPRFEALREALREEAD